PISFNSLCESSGSEMERFLPPWRTPPSRAILLVALAFALGGAPSAALAGCGDHVRFSGQPPEAANKDHSTTPAPKPCRAPPCPGGDSPPLVPPGSAPRVAPGHDLPPTPGISPPVAPASLDRPSAGALLVPAVGLSAVFHPPR